MRNVLKRLFFASVIVVSLSGMGFAQGGPAYWTNFPTYCDAGFASSSIVQGGWVNSPCTFYNQYDQLLAGIVRVVVP